jgi:hypothetical protein
MLLKDLLERLRYLYVLEKGFQIHDKVRIKKSKRVWIIYGSLKECGVSDKLFTYYVGNSEDDYKEVLGKDLRKVVSTSCEKRGAKCRECQ